jgi:hypothetical protein
MFLSLGKHPPSDSFIPRDMLHREVSYPLDVYVCTNCWLVQLLDVVDAREMFGDYAYLASQSRALVAHYEDLTARITREVGLGSGDVAVDIGCNDGVLIRGYKNSVVAVGVDPSTAAEVAISRGFNVLHGFWNAERSAEILRKFGPAKIITATNVFAHVDDMHSFTAAIPPTLRDDGVLMIEASYLIDVIDEVLFDTVYHEHLCYLSLTPMVPFLERHGLEVFDVERVPFGASGPAIRVWAQKKGGHRKVQPTVQQRLDAEKVWGANTVTRYDDYARRVHQLKHDLLTLIGKLKAEGKTVGGYGAPAKGSTLLNFMGLTSKDIPSLAETNVRKIGKLTPGSHIPIISEEQFMKNPPDYALLLAWNYLDFFLEHSPYIKGGGKFIVPMPTPRVEPQ